MITATSWASLFEAAREATAAVTPQELADRVLPHLGRAVDASLAVWYRQRRHGIEGFVPRGAPDPFPDYARYAASDPFQAVKHRLNPRLCVISDLVDRATLRRSPAANELYPAFDAERHLVARLGPTPFARPGAAAIVLCRSRRQPAWSAAELALVERALPILERAALRSRAGDGRAALAATLSQILAGVDCGAVAVFDGAARAVWASPRAEGLLAHHLGKRRKLPAALLGAIRDVAAFAGGDAPRALALDVEVRGRDRLRAALRTGRLAPDGPPLVIVQLHSFAGPAAIRDFGFSRAEQAVAARLARGLDNRGIAQQLFVSPETVRTHLRRVFAKLGVHRRVDAVLRLRGLEAE